MADLTVVIPSRGAFLGLWATIHSCHQELEASGVNADFVVVTNGELGSPEQNQCFLALKDKGVLRKHIHSNEPLTPPVARQRGVAETDSKYVAFFDNHCLVARDYFKRALLGMGTYGMDMLHSTTIFYANNVHNYEYRLKLDYNFWGEAASMPYSTYKPYQIMVGGHGGFLVKRSAWDEVGGYGPEELFNGYGGEEVLFDLKMWRYGKSNFIDPKVIHYHYVGDRGYSRHFTDDYYTNMLVTANVIGGEKWLYKVFDSFITKSHIRLRPKKHMYDILETAYNKSNVYAKEVDANSKYSLDELLVQFRENQVRG
jgi:hypothetical protein